MVVTVLLVWAGLEPFDFARPNGVSAGGSGLEIEDFGLAATASEIGWSMGHTPTPMTIEVWMTSGSIVPADREPRAWLVLLDDSRLTPLGFRQEGADLIIWDAVTNPGGDRWYNDRRLPGVLRAGQRQHLAIVSGEGPPRVYVDGRPAAAEGGFGIPLARAGEPFGGLLVLGSGPPWDTAWSGAFEAVALWGRVLADEELRDRSGWQTPGKVLRHSRHEALIAAFDFSTHGRRFENLSGGGQDLTLPEFFRPPKRVVLAPLDFEGWDSRWFATDVLLNLGGFFLFGYLLVRAAPARPRATAVVLVAAALGFGLSLLFELVQVYMVTRSSTVQDLLLNTLGGLAGALSARWKTPEWLRT